MSKLNGGGFLPDRPSAIQLLRGFSGGAAGIFILSQLSYLTTVPWLMAPFGATCVILFAASASPFAQPRNVIGGHTVSAAIGLIFLYLFDN